MNALTEEKLNILKCSKCNNYLSVPPVCIDAQGEYSCGRCQPSTNSTRLLLYEVLAQEFTFPCQNHKLGCEQWIKWSETKHHEKSCNKRPYLCPMSVSMNCLWRGLLIDISDHLRNEHLISSKDVNVVKIKVRSNLVGCKLLLFNNKKYLFNVNYNNESKSLEMALVQMEHEEKLDKYRFKLFSEDQSRQILLPVHPVFSYALKRSIETQDGNCVNEQVVSYITNNTDTLFCEIITVKCGSGQEERLKEKDLLNNNNNNNKRDSFITNVLECPVCNEFMRAPIFQCQTGHSFCFTCTPALKKCPLCREGMLKTRNFALENIANRHVIDCSNKLLGCDFKGFPTEVKVHEGTCRIVNCNVTGCLWSGSEIALVEHGKAHEEKRKQSQNNRNRCIKLI